MTGDDYSGMEVTPEPDRKEFQDKGGPAKPAFVFSEPLPVHSNNQAIHTGTG